MEIFFILFGLFYLIAYIGSGWLIFEKANYPAWYSLIPIFNMYIMLKMVNLSGFYMFLFFVPIINFAAYAYFNYRFAIAFGKGTFYTLGLIFLNPIFFIMLGFGDAQYLKSKSFR